MNYPRFYDQVAPFVLKDDLANFLGACEDGIVEISYLDCVKLAGHSCPTVAGSFILAKVALRELFGNETPRRAAVKIAFKEAKSSGVTGVIGSVAGFILGSSDEGGFSGIGGKFNRRGLLSFDNSNVEGMVNFTRVDNGKSITLTLDTSIVPGNPKMKNLMQLALSGQASEQEQKEFAALWQERVEFMLTNEQLWDKITQKGAI